MEFVKTLENDTRYTYDDTDCGLHRGTDRQPDLVRNVLRKIHAVHSERCVQCTQKDNNNNNS